MCTDNLYKVALDSTEAGIQSVSSNRQSKPIPPRHWATQNYTLVNILISARQLKQYFAFGNTILTPPWIREFQSANLSNTKLTSRDKQATTNSRKPAVRTHVGKVVRKKSRQHLGHGTLLPEDVSDEHVLQVVTCNQVVPEAFRRPRRIVRWTNTQKTTSIQGRPSYGVGWGEWWCFIEGYGGEIKIKIIATWCHILG